MNELDTLFEIYTYDEVVVEISSDRSCFVLLVYFILARYNYLLLLVRLLNCFTCLATPSLIIYLLSSDSILGMNVDF